MNILLAISSHNLNKNSYGIIACYLKKRCYCYIEQFSLKLISSNSLMTKREFKKIIIYINLDQSNTNILMQ